MFQLIKNTCLFLFIFSFFTFAHGEIINKIEINGNKRISNETIKMFSDVQLNDNVDINEIDIILKKIYKSNFFDNVSVTLDNDTLKINLIEKPIIQNINYKGLKSKKILEDILKARVLKPRYSYDKNSLKNDKNEILSVIKSAGYYFSKIDTNVEILDDNKVNVIYDIAIGDKSKIDKISFIGDKVFKDRKLKNIIISEEYKFWKFISGKKFLNNELIEFDNRLLRNFYLNQGYHDVKINSSFAKLTKDNKFELIFNINANKKFFFDNIDLQLTQDFEKNNFLDVYSFFDELKDKPYSINKIQKIIDMIERIALSEQYQSVKVTLIEDIVSNKINLKFKIDETENFFVERINIFGNNITQENVIRNQLELDEGDPYNEILYNKSINNIKSLNFFKSTKAEVVKGTNDESRIINIFIEEKATGEISLGAGTGTSGATLGLSVKENNFLGKGINFEATSTITEETIKGKFYAKNPNFRNSNKSVYIGFDAIEIDRSTEFGYKTNKTGFSVGTRFEYLDDFNLGIGLTNFYEKISTDSSASALQKTQDGNYWDSFLKLDFDHDKRNQKFQTSDGYRSFYSLDLPLISDTRTLINSFHYDYFTELYNENITNVSFLVKTANSITDKNIKLSERLFIPGSSLRGFERGKIGPKDGEDFIGGNFVTAANIQSTLPNILSNLQDIDLIIFFDIANVWGVDYNSAIDEMGEFRSSIGLGADWSTPIGPLNFTFAQPITKENSDITETFRFNLGTTF